MIANIGIRLSPQEKESLAAIAKQTDTTISQIMRRLIRTFITAHGENETAAQKENDYEHK
jgi:predicted transcriptional regulator